VTIQDPKGMHWGGALAGPVFKKVMSFVLQSEGVQPTTAPVTTFKLTEAALKDVKKSTKKAGA
jgi:cell division protein FtsI (penicillin-binding protein 3)